MGARKKKAKKTKNRAYYMRFQPKMRRRRQAKTDYQARRTLVFQDKDKYNAARYRLVVRITNRTVICQIVSSKIIGDEVLCAAYSSELPNYGLNVGLTNYAACYATGLLLARRVLKKLGLAEQYEGAEEVSGDWFCCEREEEDGKNPFSCVLDVGLRPTTTGARVYAAMKGAVDGGIAIPYTDSGKPFPGWYKDEESGQQHYEADTLRKYIFGGHVADYMNKLQDEDEEKYEKQFSQYIKQGVSADDLEDLYSKVHAAIRADPSAKPKKVADKAQVSKYAKRGKKTLTERRDHVLNRILSIRNKAMRQ